MSSDLDERGQRFGHLPTLDGWRAVAIGMVIVSHTAMSAQFAPRLGARGVAALQPMGYVGVQVFFAISGFLICSRLLHERRTRGRISLRTFYVRRAFRILPASLAFMAVVGGLMLAGAIPPSAHDWLVSVGTISNYSRPSTWCFTHFWSLAVEEHFYLVWPTLLIATGRRGLATAVTLAVGVAAWRMTAAKLALWPIDATFWGRTDLQSDGLLWGCAAAFLYADPRTRDRLATWLRWPGWSVVVVVVVVTSFWGPKDWKVRQGEMFLARMLMPAVILGTVLHPTRLAGRLLEAWPVRAVGWVSYSLYLWQQMFVFSQHDRPAWLARIQGTPWPVPLSLACAVASYLLVERPLVRLGHRLTRPRKTAPSPTTGAQPKATPALSGP